jgi:tRNA(His) guanylyltransferase
MSKDEMGDRMKKYEAVATATRLDVSLPICARIDGRSFSSFTRGCEKPFDARLSMAMRKTAAYLVEETHAKIGYTQSDEITLVWENVEGGSIIFDGRVQKMTSVFASMAGVKFFSVYGGEKLPAFDCRVWQAPSREEAANVFLWRVFDARKNATISACRSHFSAKKMHGKRQADMREMLRSVGIDFDTAYPAEDRFGVFFRRVTGAREIDRETLAKIPERYRPESRLVTRSWVEQVDMPFFGDVTNRVSVVFDGADPSTEIEK